MSRTIQVLPEARADILRNVRWMVTRSSAESATRWQLGIDAAIKSLNENPERYPEADEAADLGIDLRMLIHGRRRQTFRILFTYDDRTVNIHRVLHAAQDRLTPDDL